jgi:hypothetical protein
LFCFIEKVGLIYNIIRNEDFYRLPTLKNTISSADGIFPLLAISLDRPYGLPLVGGIITAKLTLGVAQG